MKRCAKCGEEKPRQDFYPVRDNRDGLAGACKACHSLAAKAWREANREKVRADKRTWYLANRDRIVAKALAWQREHREHRREYLAARYQASRDRLLAYSAEYQRKTGYRYSRARRAKTRGASAVEHVDANEVLRRGQGDCGICRLPVDPNDFHVDHIIPLSRGGEHSYANTQPAHPACNRRKGASLAA